MKVTKAAIPDVLILEPRVHEDERGFLFENFNCQVLAAIGFSGSFVQDNHSRSNKNVLRGLHYQLSPHAQGKLVRVVVGEIFDVAVDLRRNSATFGRWASSLLSAENKKIMWIPPGFAHGFLVISETADCLYKTSAYYAPQCERTVRWDDTHLKIEWPITSKPLVSQKDSAGSAFRDAEVFD